MPDTTSLSSDDLATLKAKELNGTLSVGELEAALLGASAQQQREALRHLAPGSLNLLTDADLWCRTMGADDLPRRVALLAELITRELESLSGAEPDLAALVRVRLLARVPDLTFGNPCTLLSAALARTLAPLQQPGPAPDRICAALLISLYPVLNDLASLPTFASAYRERHLKTYMADLETLEAELAQLNLVGPGLRIGPDLLYNLLVIARGACLSGQETLSEDERLEMEHLRERLDPSREPASLPGGVAHWET